MCPPMVLTHTDMSPCEGPRRREMRVPPPSTEAGGSLGGASLGPGTFRTVPQMPGESAHSSTSVQVTPSPLKPCWGEATVGRERALRHRDRERKPDALRPPSRSGAAKVLEGGGLVLLSPAGAPQGRRSCGPGRSSGPGPRAQPCAWRQSRSCTPCSASRRCRPASSSRCSRRTRPGRCCTAAADCPAYCGRRTGGSCTRGSPPPASGTGS